MKHLKPMSRATNSPARADQFASIYYPPGYQQLVEFVLWFDEKTGKDLQRYLKEF